MEESTNQEVQNYTDGDGGDQLASNHSMESFFEEILNDTHACTHTHTCNHPVSGQDLSHTHTCFHVHTKILSAPTKSSANETVDSIDDKPCVKKRSCGNREAVRKYREKKKAKTTSLEDENRVLRMENQMLLKKMQSFASLEAENTRLKCLLVDLRGRIDGEIGSFPYQKLGKVDDDILVTNNGMNGLTLTSNARAQKNSCNLDCDNQMYCVNPDNGTEWCG